MAVQDGIAGSAAVAGWSETLGELHERISHRFARSEARERVRRYLLGLLGQVERKNGWRLAEAIGERDPQGVQRLLNSAKWDAEEVRDDLRDYVVEHLADEETGILIVDETGFLKKGEKSVGVARQYTGTAGDTVNCQVGVFLAYASVRGAAFVDRALYLPKRWADAPVRRTEAGVPEEIFFENKIELAERMLERAFEDGVPARWIVADSFYGRLHTFREWLEERGRPYAVMVPKTNAVPLGGRKKKIEQHVERLPEDAFSEVRPARDEGGRRPWEWACLDLAADPEKGMRRWLLVRRSTDEPEDLGFYCLDSYPDGTPRLRIPPGKSRRERVVPVTEEAADAIHTLQKDRSQKERGLRDDLTGEETRRLFLRLGKLPNRCYLFDHPLADACRRAGLVDNLGRPTISPHRFRHTVGHQLAEKGARLQTIMSVLGHLSPEMSIIYARISDKQVLNDYKAVLAPGAEIAGPLAETIRNGELPSSDVEWIKTNFFETELELGRCLRLPQEGPCECDLFLTCPKFVTAKEYSPRLRERMHKELILAETASENGWGREIERHRCTARRVERLLEELGEPADIAPDR